MAIAESDGEITVKYDDDELSVHVDMPDTDGRVGKIYSERFGAAFDDMLDAEEHPDIYPLAQLIKELITTNFKVDMSTLSLTADFDRYGLSSLEKIELVMFLEQKVGFDIPETVIDEANTIETLARAVLQIQENQ